MSEDQPSSEKSLEDAYETFLAAPTSQNQEMLMQGALRYREKWIEARASNSASPADRNSPSDAPTRYKRIFSVAGKQPDGTEILLALQIRTSHHVHKRPWHVVSWRTRLSPGGHNRRFYMTAGSPWSMKADSALAMLETLEAKNGLQDRYQDKDRNPEFIVAGSDVVDASENPTLLAEVTMEGEDWGPNAKLVVLTDPNSKWRKVMIVHPERNAITFRSTTTDTTYRPRAELRPGSEWCLDNSMQDVSVQQARAFLNALRSLLS
jgi:hypothetical protein